MLVSAICQWVDLPLLMLIQIILVVPCSSCAIPKLVFQMPGYGSCYENRTIEFHGQDFILVFNSDYRPACLHCIATVHECGYTRPITAGKLKNRNNLLMKLAGSTWSASANTLRSSALALCYSAAEYCAPVW